MIPIGKLLTEIRLQYDKGGVVANTGQGNMDWLVIDVCDTFCIFNDMLEIHVLTKWLSSIFP